MILLSTKKFFGLSLICAILTITLQVYIGNSAIYFKREASDNTFWIAQHEGILNNSGLRMNGVNLRVGVVYFADWVSRATGLPVMKVYRWIDHLCLFFGFFLLALILAQWFDWQMAFIGLLFYAFSQITTYFPGGWHPWDRVSQIWWIVSLYLVQKNQLGSLFWVLLVGMLIKYDLIMISGVYFLTYVSRTQWIKTLSVSALLFVTCAGTLWWLTWILPGCCPDTQQGFTFYQKVVGSNIAQVLETPWSYAPFLVFSAPLFFGSLGWGKATAFEKGGFALGGLALIGYFLTSYFSETRAEMPLLLMMLPCALRGLQVFTSKELA